MRTSTPRPEVVVSEHDVPVVAAAEPSKAEKRAAPRAPSSAVPSTSLRTVAELAPIDIKSFSMVGVTWRSGVPNDAEVEVRWRHDGSWSRWTDLHNDVENTWTEGGRPGTEPQWVDQADGVAVRVRAHEPSTPRDLRVATVDPGKLSGTTPVAAAVGQPPIISRSSWGAKSGSGCDAPSYGSTTRGAVIHHTAGSNSYTQERLCFDRPGHAGVSHERPRLVRHRLQLPDRQVRPDLRGPRRRHRQARPRSALRQRSGQRGDDGRLAHGHVHAHRCDRGHEVRDRRSRRLALLRLQASRPRARTRSVARRSTASPATATSCPPSAPARRSTPGSRPAADSATASRTSSPAVAAVAAAPPRAPPCRPA